jgi:uncharacterized protein (UPF0276 family)
MFPAIGYAVREENRHLLNDPALDGAEITFECADDPLRTERYLGAHDFRYVSLHALKLSVASSEPPAAGYLEALKAVAQENGAAAVSDHLAFTRDGNDGVEVGHFVLPPLTPAARDAVCRNVEVVQRHFPGVPFFLENIAYFFRLRGTMPEGEFLAQILERTGCGLLLDVANVYTNARNHGYDAGEFIRRVMPAARRVQIHLAGGYEDEQAGLYIDSHSEPVPAEVWDLYCLALGLGRSKVEAVFIERDENHPDEGEWRRELRQARRLAEEAEG